jgi:hypothetical protein
MTDYTGMTTTQERNQLIREVAARDGEIAALKREKSMTQDQWQPIETLPNNSGGQVIAWPVLPFRDHERTQVASCSVDFARMSGAIHWMPLPAAPKGLE